MNTQQANIETEKQQDAVIKERSLSVLVRYGMKVVYAEALLDQVDTAQLQIQHLQDDISLLQTAENALDLLSENMAKIRRLATEKQVCSGNDRFIAELNHEIRNLLMINMLVEEDTELNGHYLFRDDIIRMNCCESGELVLTTARIPDIAGIDNNDVQATLDSLDTAARIINRQYERISSLMRALLNYYQQLQCEITVLLTAQQELKNKD